jgi:long-chain fatty acid transport protein
MKTKVRTLFRLTPLAACLAAAPVWATNGMNMEGYGPISTGMGGASQAIDHGTAGMAQNPATLALMAPGARVDGAIGLLGPDINSSVPNGPSADSGGTSYVMPAFGYARRNGALTYGFGIFAQGGMGTEYSANTFLAMGSGEPVRSELGVGRVLLPVAYQVTKDLAIGASLDFVWASLDLRMAMPGATLGQLVTGADGTLATMLGGFSTAPWARVDFSNSSDFSGAAKATGWGGKLGLVYQASPEVTLGASYHFKTSLSDMKTGGSGADLSACVLPTEPPVEGAREQPQALTCDGGGVFLDSGRITVQDFQWPAMIAVGAAWQATPTVLLAMDVKRIQWSDVMASFKMRYQTDGNGMVPDGSVSFALPQNWKDQTVTNLGVAWQATSALTVRAGLNFASNPIPDAYVNPLFPATVEKHYTAGLGYRFSPVSELNGSLTVAPSVKVTNGDGIEISHKQMNVQVMYSHRF